MTNTFVIKIEAPELTAAVKELLALVSASRVAAPAAAAPVTAAPVTAAPAAAAPVTAAPVTAAPVTAAPVTAAPVTSAPVTAAPAYTLDQLASAAAPLMDAGKQEQLMALLAQFQVKCLNDLPAAQFGAFAAALRGLGARL